MNKYNPFCFISRAFYLIFFSLALVNPVFCQTIFPPPEGIIGADDYAAEVYGKPLFVYNVLVSKGDAAPMELISAQARLYGKDPVLPFNKYRMGY